MSVAHRPADERYHRFVVRHWVASFRDADSAGMIAASDWDDVMTPQVTNVLARPGVVATVAYETTNDDAGSNAYGFIVANTRERPGLVFYVYVKTAFRRAGVARGLFAAVGIDPELPFDYVCRTPWCHELQRKIPMARWTPSAGRFPTSERRGRQRR